MSHAENQVRSSGLRMEPAVFRIKTIYRNYQRARFIEFDRTAFSSSSPVPPFFRRWQRALRLSTKSASEKLPIRTCMASDTHTVQPRRFPILFFFCFFVFLFYLFIFFFLGRANELTAKRFDNCSSTTNDRSRRRARRVSWKLWEHHRVYLALGNPPELDRAAGGKLGITNFR